VRRHTGASIYAIQGLGRQVRAERKQWQMAAFAERLSEHGSIANAAREVGITYKTAEHYFAQMRRELGPQAV
jgi:molybdenum-dependent DNA-binding transcriptional regulator ModE